MFALILLTYIKIGDQGTTNCHAVLQAALDAIDKDGGGTLHLTQGTYYLGEPAGGDAVY